MQPERRSHPPEYEQANLERLTKQAVIGTLCLIGLISVVAECLMPFWGITPTEALNNISFGSFTGLIGILVKTGVDVAQKPTLPADIGKAVVDASEEKPIVITGE